MKDQDFAKFLVYSKDLNVNIIDLPDIENTIPKLKNKKVFFNRRVDQILNEGDIWVYITLYNYLPFSRRFEKSKVIDVTKIEVGVVCHKDCRDSLIGLRDVGLITCISKLLTSKSLGIGEITLDGISPSYNMPPEYTGFRGVFSIDHFGEISEC